MPAPAQPYPKTDAFSFVGGTAMFVDDIRPAGLLHMAVVRSTRAHARLLRLDTGAAEAASGVVRVVDGRAAAPHLHPMPYSFGDPELIGGRRATFAALPVDTVRYVGEPIAVVAADSVRAARAAADLVTADYEDLPVLHDVRVFLEGDTPDTSGVTPPDLRQHVIAENRFRSGDPDGALATAPHRLQSTFHMQRSTTAPLEPRGYVASWDGSTGRLTVDASHQQPFQLRNHLAQMLALPEESVRVVVPKVGGSFGLKMTGAVEEPLVCLLSMLCGRPVKWIETRAECLLGGGREQINRVQVGFDDRGRISVLHDEIVIPVGAESPSPGWRQAFVSAATLPSGYDIPHVAVRSRVVATNEPPWHSCRGFGKEAPIVVMERVMDLVARSVGLDPAEVRRVNLLRPGRLPHRLPSGYAIDSGDFSTVLDKTLALARYDPCHATVARRGDGLLDGVGIAFEVTPEGGGHASGRSADLPVTVAAVESATVELDERGHVRVLSGVTNPGGGNETSLAKLAAAELGTTRDQVDVVQGDTDLCPPGTGNASSRATAVGGAAVVLAARELALDLRAAAAAAAGVPVEQVTLRAGAAHTPSAAPIPFAELRRCRPTLSRTRSYHPGQERAGNDTTEYRYSYPYFSSGAYVARVTVDAATGAVKLRSITAVHDCGRVIEEVLVEGQLQGAIAMGVGLALFETSGFDTDGASTTRSFKEYMIPRPNDLPSFTIAHHETPSPNTLLGAKGAGEAGVGGALAAVANAVDDALAAAGARSAVTTFPLSPPQVLALLNTRPRPEGHAAPAPDVVTAAEESGGGS